MAYGMLYVHSVYYIHYTYEFLVQNSIKKQAEWFTFVVVIVYFVFSFRCHGFYVFSCPRWFKTFSSTFLKLEKKRKFYTWKCKLCVLSFIFFLFAFSLFHFGIFLLFTYSTQLCCFFSDIARLCSWFSILHTKKKRSKKKNEKYRTI